jgi:diacylglycerol kinase (ATP)
MADPFRLSTRSASFRAAFRGLGLMLTTEPNARIHALATIIVLSLGFLLDIDRTEWLIVILTVALVWSLEAINTALEAICDVVSPEQNPKVGRAKDVAAGAVLIAAVAAVLVAILVFGPRLVLLVA